MSLTADVTNQVIQELPRHVAIIMDGNGRWAQQRGKMRVFGHKAGVEALRRTVTFASDIQLQALTLFAFSSENWRRPDAEVTALMELFVTVLGHEAQQMHKKNIQLRIIGDTTRFSDRLQKKIIQAQNLTAHNTGLILNIAANYGGQWDILQGVRNLATQVEQGTLTAKEITEDLFAQQLCLSNSPAVDLLIRTGGEQRISNFLLWQLAYSEFYFSADLWPDFDATLFSDALASFVSRERRFGCTGQQIRALINTPSNDD